MAAVRPRHVLIIDEVDASSSVYKPVTYSDFIDEAKDNVRLIIITSKNALSAVDKKKALAFVEMDRPTANGLVELWAQRLHKQHRIDAVYTKQEDLILRAAHIRRLLGLTTGMLREDAVLFRDKEAMKAHAKQHGFPVPAFARVFSPADVLAFAELHDFPVIVKPTLGSASAGIRVIRDDADLEQYLEKEFYDRIDDQGKTMDYSGDLIVEAFLKDRRMFHVNGYAKDGKIVHVWPFMYLNTNLEFTQGTAYGNVLIPQSDSRWAPLVAAAQQLLSVMPCPEHLVFHLELFEETQSDTPQDAPDGRAGQETQPKYVLCEIAARRPGGSIALLIDDAEGGGNVFPETEFRLNIGLSRRDHGLKPLAANRAIGDLMVPKKIGRLVSLPDLAQCPTPNVTFKVFATAGTDYHGFDINKLNTCCRIIASGEGLNTAADVENALASAHRWLDAHVVYEPLDDQPT
ncbi:ATP-grasp domain-containing protein [Entophlyctis helioformis]|nr:ATP-grasp domain-containing protein [Entophlyctis helioformis]